MTEWVGWLASALVLATFCMRGMVALRLMAIASNLAFIAYGATAGIDPVLMLHMVLLPLNAWRLAQANTSSGPASGPASRTDLPLQPAVRSEPQGETK